MRIIWIYSISTNRVDSSYIKYLEGIRGLLNPIASIPQFYPKVLYNYSLELSKDNYIKDETRSKDIVIEVSNSPLYFSEDTKDDYIYSSTKI